MKELLVLTKKELKDYFISPIAYVVIITFTLLVGIMFAKDIFVYNQASMRRILTEIDIINLSIPIPVILILIIPAITMRSWAEEKREGTLEIISTLPISRIEIVIAKFLSAFIFTTQLILLTIPIPITLNLLGNPDNGVIIAGYLGLILLSATYILIGQLVSINTQNQIVALIVSIVLIGILYTVGESGFLIFVPTSLRTFFEAFGLGSHFRSIARGVLDSRDILYYLSIILLLFMFIYKSLSRIKRTGK